MEDQRIEYVGGQPEVKRRPLWPFALGGAVLLLIVVAAAAVAWNPLRKASRAVGTAVSPYALDVDGQWVEYEKVVGRPAELTLVIKNADHRAIDDGLTVRMGALAPTWSFLGTTPEATRNDGALFFAGALGAGESKTVSVKLLPLQGGRTQFQFSISAGHSTQPAKLNRQGTVLSALAFVLEAKPGDSLIRPTIFGSPRLPVESEASWRLRIENVGKVQITSVTLQFADLPRSFEVTATNPDATVSGDGRTMRFATKLDPGEETTVTVRFVPHRRGEFHIATTFFLSDQTEPSMLAGGSNLFEFDVTVG